MKTLILTIIVALAHSATELPERVNNLCFNRGGIHKIDYDYIEGIIVYCKDGTAWYVPRNGSDHEQRTHDKK